MRIIIYDYQLLFSEALGALFLERGHSVVGLLVTPQDIVDTVQTTQVDVCLATLDPAHADGISGIAALKRQVPGLPIVVLTANLDISEIRQAIKSGAHGVCTKLDGFEEIERVMFRTTTEHTGHNLRRTTIWSQSAQTLARRSKPASGNIILTPREKTVLEALVRGSNTAEIAFANNIGEATVRTHVQHLFQKFGVHSRIALVAYAIRADIVQVQRSSTAIAEAS